ncbi:MAG: hypothetical protein CVU56_18940 [Deltaproteobacteria bacterium HGW-Deltaproteobacteria-14]|jgi:hypothetical protein|nr:MAG: hypothetical protein CVU56_18940 [Deltaproteobacteria bacterium HGW-Deltaproteobacteria-14]
MFVYWITTLMLLVLGVFASADRLVAGRPNARDLLATVKPFEGWVGLVGIFFGFWSVIDHVVHIGMIKASVLGWVIGLAVAVLCVAIGFLLAFGLMGGLLAKNDAAKQKADEVYGKLAPWRPSLGMTAISTAILSVILRIVT